MRGRGGTAGKGSARRRGRAQTSALLAALLDGSMRRRKWPSATMDRTIGIAKKITWEARGKGGRAEAGVGEALVEGGGKARALGSRAGAAACKACIAPPAELH